MRRQLIFGTTLGGLLALSVGAPLLESPQDPAAQRAAVTRCLSPSGNGEATKWDDTAWRQSSSGASRFPVSHANLSSRTIRGLAVKPDVVRQFGRQRIETFIGTSAREIIQNKRKSDPRFAQAYDISAANLAARGYQTAISRRSMC